MVVEQTLAQRGLTRALVGKTMRPRGFLRLLTLVETLGWSKSQRMSVIPAQHLRGVQVWSVVLEPNVPMTR